MTGDNQHKNLRDALKGLPKIKAGRDFEQRLMSKLKDTDEEKYLSPSFKKLHYPKKSFSLFGFLRPSLAPAIGLTIVLIIFIAYYINISIIQKQTVQQDISQNTQGIQPRIETSQPKTETEPPLTREDNSLRDSKSTDRSNIQSPPMNMTGDNESAPSISSPEKRLEEPKMVPEVEEKGTDELKKEEKVMDKTESKEKRADDYIMRKSGEYQYKDTGKQNDEDIQDSKHEGNKNNESLEEQTLSKDAYGKTDSTKIRSKRNKKVAKAKNYNDTIKAPVEQEPQSEDSTKVNKK